MVLSTGRFRIALGAILLAGIAPASSSQTQVADSAAAEHHHVRAREFMVADQFDSAAVEYAEAVRIRTLLGDSAGLASSLNSLGSAHYQVGAYEFALEAFLRSLDIRRALHDSTGVARVLTNVGKTYQDWRQFDRSLRALDEAVTTAERIDAPLVLAYALNTLALLKSDIGDQAGARAAIARSLALYASRNPPVTTADSAVSGWLLNVMVLGLVEMRDGKPESAIAVLRDAVRIAAGADRPRGEARARLYMGQAYRAKGDLPRAERELVQALTIARDTRQRVVALEALRELGEVEEQRGNAAAALRDIRAFRALNDTIFDQTTAQRLAVMESRMERERQQRENARLVAEQGEQRTLIVRQRIAGLLGALVLLVGAAAVVKLLRLNAELRVALAEVRTLKGFIPICAHCKSVRDDRGFWEAVETYVSSRSEAMFSHSICPNCGPTLYGEEWPDAPEARSAPEP